MKERELRRNFEKLRKIPQEITKTFVNPNNKSIKSRTFETSKTKRCFVQHPHRHKPEQSVRDKGPYHQEARRSGNSNSDLTFRSFLLPQASKRNRRNPTEEKKEISKDRNVPQERTKELRQNEIFVTPRKVQKQ